MVDTLFIKEIVMMRSIVSLSIISILILALVAGRLLFAMPPALVTQPAADFQGVQWLNSSPLTLQQMKGKVVMVEFWTYGCYNCVNVEPYVKKWYEQYNKSGFVVVAVHSPEFSHEREIDNVRAYVQRKGIKYPVVIDNDFAIWRRYSNRYWPAMYLIDKQGQLRYRSIGEGRYAQTEKMIQNLLAE